MRRTKWAGPIAVIVALLIASGACGGATKGGQRSPAVRYDAHLTDYADDDGPNSTVVLTGAIGDFGHATRIGGGAKSTRAQQLELVLSRGSFRLDVTTLETAFRRVVAAARFVPSTCSAVIGLTRSARIIEGSGTGSYVGITGSFKLTATLDEIVDRSHCDATGTFIAQSIVISGFGSVSL